MIDVLTPKAPVRPPAAAKVRILETANILFYDEGIRSVGVDRIISESSVTKATFYKHYGSKDTLIRDYVLARHALVKKQIDDILATKRDAHMVLVAIREALITEISRPEFRGCPFLNAASEFVDAGHPVRQIVNAHREWYTEMLAELLKSTGHPMPGDGADDLLLARDGAMAGAYAGDAIAAAASLSRNFDRTMADASL